MSAAAIAFPVTPDIRQQRARQHDRVLADRTLKPGAKNAYTVLHRRCYASGECDDSIESLAERAGMGESTFRDHARILRRRGHVEWTRTGRENRWFLTGQTQQSDRLKFSTLSAEFSALRPAQDNTMPRALLEEYINTEKTTETTVPVPPPVEVPAPPVVIPMKAPISANAPVPTAGDSPIIDVITQEAGPQIAKLAKFLPPEVATQAVAAAQEYRENNEVTNFRGLLRIAFRQRWKPNNHFYYNEIRRQCSLATVCSASPTTAPGTVSDHLPAATVPYAAEFPRCSICSEPMTPFECLIPQEQRHARCSSTGGHVHVV